MEFLVALGLDFQELCFYYEVLLHKRFFFKRLFFFVTILFCIPHSPHLLTKQIQKRSQIFLTNVYI